MKKETKITKEIRAKINEQIDKDFELIHSIDTFHDYTGEEYIEVEGTLGGDVFQNRYYASGRGWK